MNRLAICTVAALLAVPRLSSADGPLLTNQWAAFRTDAAVYRTGVGELLDKARTMDTPSDVTDYLAACRTFADDMLALTESPKLAARNRDPVRAALDRRERTRNALLNANHGGHELARGENRLFNEHLHDYLYERYLESVNRRVVLFDHKYFEDDDPESANFAEAWLNSHLSWTRFDAQAGGWFRDSGVSALEVTFRAEPIVLLSSANDAGALLTIGQVLNFFPHFGEDGTGSAVTDTWASDYVRRLGARVGLGAKFGGDAALLAGCGVQVRVFTIWCVYDVRDEKWDVALGLSEWGWIEKWLPCSGTK